MAPPKAKKVVVEHAAASATTSERGATSKSATVPSEASDVVKMPEKTVNPKEKTEEPSGKEGSLADEIHYELKESSEDEEDEEEEPPQKIAGDYHGWIQQEKPPFETCKQVEARLAELVPKNKLKKVSVCLKAAILRGFIDLSVDDPLNQIIFVGTVPQLCCASGDMSLTVRLRDVLYQPDSGQVGEGFLPCAKCGVTKYYCLSEMCCGRPGLCPDYKFHKHCTDCAWFGECLGDYREFHCFGCNTHQFQRCTDCNPDSDD